MKKTLVSALTTALVVGAASTTFAAANPFADVPADHWAYDAVSELQAKGVVNGYAVDNTFRGNQNMTRYEMAQIVAKAMAKVETGDAATKAMVDKLAAEFRDELANLGVRMDDLESRMDNVKHSGFVRYRWNKAGGNGIAENVEQFVKFRLNSAVKINNHVDGFARVEWSHNVNNDVDENKGGEIAQLWVHGKVGTTDIYAGKLNPNDHASFVHGLVFDQEYTGGQVTFNKAMGKNGKVSWTLDAGKTNNKAAAGGFWNNFTKAFDNDTTVNIAQTRVLGTNVNYVNGKFDANVGYYNWSNAYNFDRAGRNYSNVGIWGVGAGYHAGDFYITADYARANQDGVDGNKDSYNFQVNYKGAKASQAKSWGAYVGYQKLTGIASPFPTYDVKSANTKGWKIGVEYAFMKNIVGSVQYYDAKLMGAGNNDKYKQLFTQVTFSF